MSIIGLITMESQGHSLVRPQLKIKILNNDWVFYMKSIQVNDLSKMYNVSRRRSGIIGAAVGLFHREYDTVNALDGISFSVEPGELVGYIGPNGAGKSTTIKILSGILTPDSGFCEVMGRVPWRDRINHVKQIGVVFGQRTQLWWDLPVIESFELLRDIYRIDPMNYRRIRDQLVDALELGALLNVPVRQLSLGQRARCDLVASLLHSPQLLFLDEPTIGLDAVAKLAVREFVSNINREEGVTVILTTHDMDDIERLANRIMIIGKGQILFDGNIQKLRSSVRSQRVLVIDLAVSNADFSEPDLDVSFFNGNQVSIKFAPEQLPAQALISRLTGKYPVKDLYVESQPIEELISRLYQELDI